MTHIAAIKDAYARDAQRISSSAFDRLTYAAAMAYGRYNEALYEDWLDVIAGNKCSCEPYYNYVCMFHRGKK